MTDAIRLAKRVAALVPCSRREAELYIAGGWVRVNGVVVDEPQHRVADDVVEIDRNATLAALAPVTFLWHKPAGAGVAQAEALLAPAARAEEDRSGIRIGRSQVAHLVPLLPLPAAASGLSVFSQEPRIIRRLTEDALTLEQELVVEVSGAIVDGGLARLCHGLSFEGRALPPIKASWQNETRLRFAMKGIAPDLVPWMCEQVGLHAVAVKRIRLGRLPMAGLPVGQWRVLRADERF